VAFAAGSCLAAGEGFLSLLSVGHALGRACPAGHCLTA
jgi:hypothetical protein